ncbi:Peptidoglycan/LPS O-acetylase OafA/YrhL, contains acyltransferase and SGNH-hydrolase domains [Cellulosimicrobium cellulans]|nr:Peptidoglycan/LPS O-acetylase OafA/YrhL, contains acyltransferase and SGNH-hydrolase domains [Cellulosimicrobium cellulans]
MPAPVQRPSAGVRARAGTGAAPDRFRLDVQGLRAVAVAAVVLYHAGVPWLPGGYVGVDVFFVISGFLITGHLLRSLETDGRLGLAEFYARRARRILPASFAVLVVTMVVAALTLGPVRVREAAVDALATAAYVPNLLFAHRGTQYLEETEPPSLFQHYWSLGVEEQFYLLWPLLLVGFFAVRRSHRVLTALVGAVVVVSFVACAVLTVGSQPWAFFGLPARAWELAAGGLVAALLHRGAALPRGLAVPIGWAGLGAVVAAVLLLDAATPFPAPWAALPVAGTAAVVLAGASAGARGPVAVLARPSMVWVGGISYSLYLVHWPAMTLPQAILGRTEPLPVLWQLLVAAACVPVAWASYRYLETPFRTAPRLRSASPRRVGAVALSATCAVALGAGLMVGVADRAPQSSGAVVASGDLRRSPEGTAVVPANLEPSLAEAGDDLPVVYADGCQLDAAEQEPARSCRYGADPGAPRVVLFGDSHASQLVPALLPLADAGAVVLEVMTKSGCPAADLDVVTGRGQPYPTCSPWRGRVLDRLASDPPSAVVVADYAGQSGAPDGARFGAQEWTDALGRTLGALPGATPVLVVGDTPTPGASPTACLSVHLDDAAACALPSDARNTVVHEAERRAAARAGARFVTLDEYLCDDASCPAVIDDTLVYRDGTHLTATMAEHLAEVLGPEVLTTLPR